MLEPVRRAAGGERTSAPAPRATGGYLDELEGAFELEALGGYYQAPGGERGAESGQQEVTWELEPAFERLAPGAGTGVGRGQSNVRDDVLRVQARLRQLGMSWVPDSGVIGAAKDDPTDHAIRLFRAMLDAKQLWEKDKHTSPCYVTPALKNGGVILPGSREEQWLWSVGAPRWLTAIPAQRDGWCCNDGAADVGCRTDIAEPALSSWLAAYLDQVGPAFRGKVQAFRPVIATLATKDGQAALERLRKHPGLPRLGPFSDQDEERKRTAAIAQRVATDLVEPAIAFKLDPTDLAAQTLGAIDGGRVTLMLTYLAVPHGGCSANHLGHQQGLEFDIRLFAHDGPRPGLTWDNRSCSRLLTGLAVDCFLDHPFTRQILYNDPEIRKRAKSRVPSVGKADGHDNHVHVGIKGADVHPLIPPPPPAPPGRGGVTVEPYVAASSNEYDLPAEGPTAAAGAKTHELRVWNADNLDTSVKFSVDEATTTTAITIVSRTPGGGSSSNTMVLTDARKGATGTEVTGLATNQPDGTGKTFNAYLKLQALPTEMVVLVYKKVLGAFVYVPGNDRHYRYQDPARAQKDLIAFIGSLHFGPSQFEVELELRRGGDLDQEMTASIGTGLDFEEVTRPQWKIDDSALMPGDIIVSTTRNPGSWAIRVATGSRVSHALLYIGEGNVVEAMVPDPVACKPLADALVDDKYSYALRYEGLSADKRNEICAFALRQVREKTPFGINLVSVLFRRGYESTDEKFFCSELVLKAYAAAGVPLTTWSSGPPKDIAKLAGTKLTYLGHLELTKRQERQLEKAAAKQQEAGGDSESLEPAPDLNELETD